MLKVVQGRLLISKDALEARREIEKTIDSFNASSNLELPEDFVIASVVLHRFVTLSPPKIVDNYEESLLAIVEVGSAHFFLNVLRGFPKRGSEICSMVRKTYEHQI